MAVFLSWLQNNWSNAIGAIGIISGLWFTAASFRQQAILALSKQHRELWMHALERPELARVLQKEADLTEPVSLAEEEFLNLVLVHFETGWQMARTGTALSRGVLARDIRGFFLLPLPMAVWEKTRENRNPEFVRFVTRALDRHGRLTGTGA